MNLIDTKSIRLHVVNASVKKQNYVLLGNKNTLLPPPVANYRVNQLHKIKCFLS